MGSRTTSTLVVRLDVNFTEKLPNGPYVEQGQGQTNFAVYVHPTATVGDVHSVFHKFFNDTMQLQQEGLPRVANVKASMRIMETKCKGGAVTEGEKLQDIMESGDALTMTIRQIFSVTSFLDLVLSELTFLNFYLSV
ncbi:hypothetical protein QOT17_011194 [Balamuthia mandrillaris]